MSTLTHATSTLPVSLGALASGKAVSGYALAGYAVAGSDGFRCAGVRHDGTQGSARTAPRAAVRVMRTADVRGSAVGAGWTKRSRTVQGADNDLFITNLTVTERPLDPPNRLSA